MPIVVSGPVDLVVLARELAAAGIPVPRGLGLNGSLLFTYDEQGEPADLPAAAAAVVQAHRSADPAALRARLRTLAAPLGGTDLQSLTLAQCRVLLGALLLLVGAIRLKQDGTVSIRPVDEWL